MADNTPTTPPDNDSKDEHTTTAPTFKCRLLPWLHSVLKKAFYKFASHVDYIHSLNGGLHSHRESKAERDNHRRRRAKCPHVVLRPLLQPRKSLSPSDLLRYLVYTDTRPKRTSIYSASRAVFDNEVELMQHYDVDGLMRKYGVRSLQPEGCLPESPCCMTLQGFLRMYTDTCELNEEQAFWDVESLWKLLPPDVDRDNLDPKDPERPYLIEVVSSQHRRRHPTTEEEKKNKKKNKKPLARTGRQRTTTGRLVARKLLKAAPVSASAASVPTTTPKAVPPARPLHGRSSVEEKAAKVQSSLVPLSATSTSTMAAAVGVAACKASFTPTSEDTVTQLALSLTETSKLLSLGSNKSCVSSFTSARLVQAVRDLNAQLTHELMSAASV